MSTKLGGRVLALAILGLTAIITIRLPEKISSVNFDGFLWNLGSSTKALFFFPRIWKMGKRLCWHNIYRLLWKVNRLSRKFIDTLEPIPLSDHKRRPPESSKYFCFSFWVWQRNFGWHILTHSVRLQSEACKINSQSCAWRSPTVAVPKKHVQGRIQSAYSNK